MAGELEPPLTSRAASPVHDRDCRGVRERHGVMNGSEPEPQPMKTSAALSTSQLNLCHRIPAGGEAGQKQARIRNGLGDRARD